MRKLQNAFHVTIKYALRGIPGDEFEAFFPEGALPPDVLEATFDAYGQCLHQIRVFIDREFDDVCADSDMANKLQSLEIMCAEQGVGDGAESGQVKASAPTQMARRAVLKAKRDAVTHLAAIKAEVDRKCEEMLQQLDERKKTARDLVAAAGPLESQLADAQTIAKSWAHRGNTSTATAGGATTPAPALPSLTA